MKHAECQLFCYVLLLMKLLDDGDLKNVSDSSIRLHLLRAGQELRRLHLPEAQQCQHENSRPHGCKSNLLYIHRLRENWTTTVNQAGIVFVLQIGMSES